MNGLDVKNEPYAWLRVEFLSETLLYGGATASICMDMMENHFFRHIHCIELDEESASYARSLAADHSVLVEEAGIAFMTRANDRGERKFGVISRIFRESQTNPEKITCALPAVWNARLEVNRERIAASEIYFPFTCKKGEGFLVYDASSNVLWTDADLSRLRPVR